MEIYKRIKQSDKKAKRSTESTAAEKSALDVINEKFIALFKSTHMD
tara:strand:- start:336 stop:473 length:138 start_codon:yes stop_codon:yes gene_type:complete